MFCLPDNLFYPLFSYVMKNFWTRNIVVYKIFDTTISHCWKINCPHNTVQIDVLKIKTTVLYDTNSVIRKHFLTKFIVQYKPSQAKLGELCPPPVNSSSKNGEMFKNKIVLFLKFNVMMEISWVALQYCDHDCKMQKK